MMEIEPSLLDCLLESILHTVDNQPSMGRARHRVVGTFWTLEHLQSSVYLIDMRIKRNVFFFKRIKERFFRLIGDSEVLVPVGSVADPNDFCSDPDPTKRVRIRI